MYTLWGNLNANSLLAYNNMMVTRNKLKLAHVCSCTSNISHLNYSQLLGWNREAANSPHRI